MRLNKRQVLILFSVLGFLSIPSYSQSKDEKDSFKQLIQEFPFSATVYVQEKNEIQQTGKYLHSESEEETGNIASYEFEYGIVDGFQLSTGYKYAHSFNVDGSSHVNSLQAGTMVSFLNNPRNELAISVDADFPLNSLPADKEANKSSVSSTLIYARQFGKMQLHLNAGAEIQNEKVTWKYNAAAVYGEGSWHPILELNTIDEENFNTFLGPGVDFTSESGWELSSGIRHGLSTKEWAATVKLIYEFTAGSKENS